MTSKAETLSSQLAAFVIETERDEIPERSRRAAVRAIANAVSLAVGASRHPACDIALETLTGLGYSGGLSLLGRDEELGLTTAPLVTGIAVHVEDFDDTHLESMIHPACVVVPAAMAAAEHVDASGSELVDAVAIGVEACLRVGLGLGQGHFDLGWHTTGTTGRVGAAAAAGRLLGVTTEQMLVALGIAATESAGLREALGTMTKAFHAGKAAADGVEAVLFARAGFTGPRAPIEGRRGLASTASVEPDVGRIVAGLGKHWEIDDNALKAYACGIVSHPVIDAAIALRDRVPAADRVAEVDILVHPVVLDVMGVTDPVTGLESKFSVYHCFSVGFLDGEAGPAQFTTRRALTPAVVELRRKVRVRTDASVDRAGAVVRVTDISGAMFDERVEHATGSVQRPMSDEQLRRKCLRLTDPILHGGATAFVDAALGVDGLGSTKDLLALGQL
ncbi:MAG: MmgE/PrpD family protein [Sciscionella sp.]